MRRRGITRREILQGSAALGLLSSVPFSFATASSDGLEHQQSAAKRGEGAGPLTPPAGGIINVAFPISDGAVVIDFAGPWEVFQDASPMDGGGFQLYTVAEKSAAIETSGGMKIMPNFTFENAPTPKVIVIPAQSGATDAMIRWIRESTKNTDVTMSVCTGALVLARTGLLSGKSATTHHNAYTEFALKYPDIQVKRGYRFVEEGKIATAGGLTSGMDLALRVVERYYGREAAEGTALAMEYQGKGWLDSSGSANAVYAKPRVRTAGTFCEICDMQLDPASALNSVYEAHTYYFCSRDHKDAFDGSPDRAIRLAAER